MGRWWEKLQGRLESPWCSLLNTRFWWLLIFLVIFACPADFHIFGWLLPYHEVCLPAFTLYNLFSLHLSPPVSSRISFPLPFFSFPIFNLISSWTLSHCNLWKKHDHLSQHLICWDWRFLPLQSPSICLFRDMEFLGHWGCFLQL